MGEPLKFNEALREQIIGALKMGAGVAVAAQRVGISRRTVYHYAEAHPEFKQRMDEARAYADDQVEQTLFETAKGGNTTAMIFWLKNRRPTEWRDRREISAEISGKDDGPVMLEFTGLPGVSKDGPSDG